MVKNPPKGSEKEGVYDGLGFSYKNCWDLKGTTCQPLILGLPLQPKTPSSSSTSYFLFIIVRDINE